MMRVTVIIDQHFVARSGIDFLATLLDDLVGKLPEITVDSRN